MIRLILKQFLFDAGLIVLLYLFILLVFSKKRIRFFKIASVFPILIMFIFCANGTAEFLALNLKRNVSEQLDANPEAACVENSDTFVVLGGGLTSVDTPTDQSFERILKASQILRAKALAGKRVTVVVSAGMADTFIPVAEAAVLAPLLKQLLGEFRDFHKIVTEEKSTDTYENAVFSREAFSALGIPLKAALLTSEVHMPRSFMTFKVQGFDVCLVPVLQKWHTTGALSFSNASKTVQVLNEYFGLLGYSTRGWVAWDQAKKVF